MDHNYAGLRILVIFWKRRYCDDQRMLRCESVVRPIPAASSQESGSLCRPRCAFEIVQPTRRPPVVVRHRSGWLRLAFFLPPCDVGRRSNRIAAWHRCKLREAVSRKLIQNSSRAADPDSNLKIGIGRIGHVAQIPPAKTIFFAAPEFPKDTGSAAVRVAHVFLQRLACWITALTRSPFHFRRTAGADFLLFVVAPARKR